MLLFRSGNPNNNSNPKIWVGLTMPATPFAHRKELIMKPTEIKDIVTGLLVIIFASMALG
jgi:hypothetical protein